MLNLDRPEDMRPGEILADSTATWCLLLFAVLMAVAMLAPVVRQ